MPTITFEANEHGQLRVELRGLAASYAGAEIVLAGGPAYSDAPLSTWASVAGVAPGDGEVAGYDLPLPQLEPGRYALEVYAATPGERRADIMPAPGETIVLKVGDRRHDNGDVTPAAQVTVQQGTSEVRAGDGGGDVRLYVRDPSGTRLDGEATHTIAASPLVVPTAGEVDVPTTYQEAMAAGYDGTEAEFYALLLAQDAGNGRQATPWKRITSYSASGTGNATDGSFAVFEDFEERWSDLEFELQMTVQRNTSVEVRARARVAGGMTAQGLTSYDDSTLNLPEKRILEDQVTCVWRVRPSALGLSPRGLFVRYETYGTSAAADYDVTDARCCLHYTPLST